MLSDNLKTIILNHPELNHWTINHDIMVSSNCIIPLRTILRKHGFSEHPMKCTNVYFKDSQVEETVLVLPHCSTIKISQQQSFQYGKAGELIGSRPCSESGLLEIQEIALQLGSVFVRPNQDDLVVQLGNFSKATNFHELYQTNSTTPNFRLRISCGAESPNLSQFTKLIKLIDFIE